MNRFRWTVLGIVVVIAAVVGGFFAFGRNNNGSSGDSQHSVAILTDTGGIDDHSFNQSAWEGLQRYGRQHDLKKGRGGYNYFQSNDASDYKPI
ncbi:hypothetical protein Q757_09020 [Oenococcus alcoholitolerans]|uniref:ABC transporter substrate-binding protein PnrA-like domain-containing protein n=1 Tax=Oenococcus alcoholitolerans TaxID=931074 RepID=A0ABR4XPJ6_9LACO|nr:hypothetical protein Q757_09020 [Oenococcus alcoholitolerans]